MLKNGNDGFRFTLPDYISGYGKQGELPLTEEEPDEEKNKRFLESLEKKFAAFKHAGEKKHTEVKNRVQFSDEVQFFKEEFPVKTEDGMEVDEEVVECFPVAPECTEDDSKKLSEMSSRLKKRNITMLRWKAQKMKRRKQRLNPWLYRREYLTSMTIKK